MAGHSKWSKVKRIKGPLDVKRGVQFSKLVKETAVAAHIGGGDLGGNPRTRSVIETACADNDNKNRPAADLRFIFSKNGGNLAASGSVLSMFHRKGQVTIPRSLSDEDRMLELTLDMGAQAVVAEDIRYVVTTPVDRFYAAAEALRGGGFEAGAQKHTCLPDNTVAVSDEATVAQVLHLYETLEDNDDTQHVYSHFDIPEEVLTRLAA